MLVWKNAIVLAMPLYGVVRKAYRQIGEDWEAGEYGPLIIYAIIFVVFCVAAVFGIMDTWLRSPSLQATGSNVSIGNNGILNQTLISHTLSPRIETRVIAPPQKQSNGFYHTTYQLTLFGSDEAPPPQTFGYADFVKCLSARFIGMQIVPPSVINTIECLSTGVPPSPDDVQLFKPI
jgi:hypothetical protein